MAFTEGLANNKIQISIKQERQYVRQQGNTMSRKFNMRITTIAIHREPIDFWLGYSASLLNYSDLKLIGWSLYNCFVDL